MLSYWLLYVTLTLYYHIVNFNVTHVRSLPSSFNRIKSKIFPGKESFQANINSSMCLSCKFTLLLKNIWWRWINYSLIAVLHSRFGTYQLTMHMQPLQLLCTDTRILQSNPLIPNEFNCLLWSFGFWHHDSSRLLKNYYSFYLNSLISNWVVHLTCLVFCTAPGMGSLHQMLLSVSFQTTALSLTAAPNK